MTRYLPPVLGALLAILVLRTGRGLWATMLLTVTLLVLDLASGRDAVAALLRSLIVFPLAGAVFWLLQWAENRLVQAAVTMLLVLGLMYLW